MTELADALEELRAYGADVDPLERQLACDLLAKLRESVALGVVTRMVSATTAHTRGNPVDDEPLTVADLKTIEKAEEELRRGDYVGADELQASRGASSTRSGH